MTLIWQDDDQREARGTARNDPKPPHEGGFDRECARCKAVLPSELGTRQLRRIGWTQESDGTWICPRVHEAAS